MEMMRSLKESLPLRFKLMSSKSKDGKEVV